MGGRAHSTQAPWPTDLRPLASAELRGDKRCAHGPPEQHRYITIAAPYAMYTGPWPRAASPLGVPNLLDGKRALPIPTTSKPMHYPWGPTPFLGACGGLAPSCYPGPLSFSHRRIRALGTHDHIYALPLGPRTPCTQAHGPALLDLWGPLKYYQILHLAHGRPHQHL